MRAGPIHGGYASRPLASANRGSDADSRRDPMLTQVKRLVGLPLALRARRLAREFLSQAQRGAQGQRDLLLSRIARNADSQFGRDHHFQEIRTPADFRKRVPVRDYEGHEPY